MDRRIRRLFGRQEIKTIRIPSDISLASSDLTYGGYGYGTEKKRKLEDDDTDSSMTDLKPPSKRRPLSDRTNSLLNTLPERESKRPEKKDDSDPTANPKRSSDGTDKRVKTGPDSTSSSLFGFENIYADIPKKKWFQGPKGKLQTEAEFLVNNEAVRKERIARQAAEVLRVTKLDTFDLESSRSESETRSTERLVTRKIENLKMWFRASNGEKQTENVEKTSSIIGVYRKNMINDVQKLGANGRAFDIDEYELVRTHFEDLQEQLAQHGLKNTAIADKHILTVSDGDFTSVLNDLQAGAGAGNNETLRNEARNVQRAFTAWETKNSGIVDTLKPHEQKRQDALKKLQADNDAIDRETTSTIQDIEAEYARRPKNEGTLFDLQYREGQLVFGVYANRKGGRWQKQLENNENKLRENADTILESLNANFTGADSTLTSVGSLEQLIRETLKDRAKPLFEGANEHAHTSGTHTQSIDRAISSTKVEVEHFINDKKSAGSLSDDDKQRVQAAHDLLTSITKIEYALQQRETYLRELQAGKAALWRFGTNHEYHQRYYEKLTKEAREEIENHTESKAVAQTELEDIEHEMRELYDRLRVDKTEENNSRYLHLETQRAETRKKLAEATGKLEKANKRAENLEKEAKEEEEMDHSDGKFEGKIYESIKAIDTELLKHLRSIELEETKTKLSMKNSVLQSMQRQLEAEQQFVISTRKVMQQLQLQQYHYMMMSCMLTASSTSEVGTNQLLAGANNLRTGFGQLLS
jgi:hypothetical protein